VQGYSYAILWECVQIFRVPGNQGTKPQAREGFADAALPEIKTLTSKSDTTRQPTSSIRKEDLGNGHVDNCRQNGHRARTRANEDTDGISPAILVDALNLSVKP